MELYTSYYNRAQYSDTSEFALFRISASAPKWFSKKAYPLEYLYPRWGLIEDYKNGIITEEEYVAEYSQRFNDRMREELLAIMENVCKAEGVTKAMLLCWEGKGKFCHRHPAGAWLDPEYTEWIGI